MDLIMLLRLCREYERLGYAVHSQLDAIMDGENVAFQNQNAVRMIEKFLRTCDKHGVVGADEVLEDIEAAKVAAE